jgi:hypothetical protein
MYEFFDSYDLDGLTQNLTMFQNKRLDNITKLLKTFKKINKKNLAILDNFPNYHEITESAENLKLVQDELNEFVKKFAILPEFELENFISNFDDKKIKARIQKFTNVVT